MYKEFYGFTQNPFEVSPDPYFFYPTPAHTEALANLVYGVLHRKGFVVVTGEVGTGKTLLVRCLQESLTRNNVAFGYVYNPLISVSEFLTYVINDLGLRLPINCTKSACLSCLNDFLMQRSRKGLTTALIVDEAQLLSWELLEEIRLLTNLETSKHKLLQIVLLGQPEFERKLDSPQLRQLKQRIGLRCSLKPLTLHELRGYIDQRLRLAGADALDEDEGLKFLRKPVIGERRVGRVFPGGVGRRLNGLVAMPVQTADNVGAHPSEADHPDLHGASA